MMIMIMYLEAELAVVSRVTVTFARQNGDLRVGTERDGPQVIDLTQGVLRRRGDNGVTTG